MASVLVCANVYVRNVVTRDGRIVSYDIHHWVTIARLDCVDWRGVVRTAACGQKDQQDT